MSAVPLLAARIERFAYDDGAPVLRGLRLALRPGTLTAVLGGSGSGTSTLAKVLAGWALAGGHAVFAGHLEVPAPAAEGSPAAPCAPAATAARRLTFRGLPGDPRLRLGAWGQHVVLVPQRAGDLLTGASATVGEEIAVALEHRGLPRAQMHAKVEAAARAVGLSGDLGRHPGALSGGQERRLAFACALVVEPAVLVLDDPTASLDAAGTAALLGVVEAELGRGAAVLVAGSRVDALARRADWLVLLEDGTVAAQGGPGEVLGSAAFARSGVLSDALEVPGVPSTTEPSIPKPRSPRPASPEQARPEQARPEHARPGPQPLALLDGVTYAYPGPVRRPVLDRARLEVRPGEVVAITGPNGSGKTTALRHLAGLLRPDAGRVLIAGRDIGAAPAGDVAGTVGTLFQEPRDQLFERTALREVAFGLCRGAPRGTRVSRSVAEARALEALAAVGLAEQAGTHPYDLPASGQRLLALAAILARAPRVLLLDEPTVGLDRHGLARLEAVVGSAADRGCGVVLSTHALAWARGQAHRVLALDGGQFAAA